MKILKMTSQNSAIILASQSCTRQKMLTFLNIDFTVVPARLDESQLMQEFIKKDNDFSALAKLLAVKKAEKISVDYCDDYIIAADSVMIFNDEIIEKSKNMFAARELLKKLRGRQQIIHSAVVVYYQNSLLFEYSDHAYLEMFDFSDDFLDEYLHNTGEMILDSVGCAMVEQEGIRLFKAIKGDYYTIMGMPLLPLANFLRDQQIIKN